MEENKYLRRKNESDFDYKARLIKYKLEDKEDIDWNEIVNLLNLQCSSDHLRKTAYGFLEAYNYLIENSTNNSDISKDIKDEIKNHKEELKQIKKEYEEYNKEIKKIEAQEERRLKVIEKDDYYTIVSKTREIKVSKDKVRAIKQLYCDNNGLEINSLCRKIGIARRDFMLIKYAFNIVHNDVPYLDEELDGDIDDLVNNTLERKKNQYFLKLAEKEIEDLKNEVKKFRSKDYLYNKIVDRLETVEIKPVQYEANFDNITMGREALLDIMDVHLGIKSDNYWNKYSVSEARKRFDILTKETIKRCADNGVKTLHVSGLGDFLCGIIHPTLRLEAEIDVVEQIKIFVELMSTMLIEFSMVFDKVVYSDVCGNHGRIMPNKSDALDNENFENLIGWTLRQFLSSYKNIVFEDNYIDDDIIVKNIAGVLIFECHGDKDKFNKIASDLTMMIEKPSEIHIGHWHENKSLENHGVEVFVGRSFSGTDTYAKDLRLTGKAGQKLFIYENGQRLYISDIVLN